MFDPTGETLASLQAHALALQADGRHHDAAAAYRAIAAAITDQRAVVRFNLGVELAAVGDLEAAAAAYQDALGDRPGWALALDNLGTVRHLQGRTDDAVQAFRAAIAAAPDEANPRYNLGAVLCATGEFGLAEVEFRAALAAVPTLAHAEQGLGLVLSAQGRLDEAVAAYRRAVALETEPTAAQLELARVLLRAGHPALALAEAEQACRERPDDAVAHGIRGAALTALGRNGDATLAHGRARELTPDRFEVHFNCGLAAEDEDDLAAAAAAYREALVRDPRRVEGLINLARVLINLGRNDELLAVYEQLRAVDPDNPRVDHMIAALRGELPPGCPPAYVVDEFDRLAHRFEEHLIGQLGYQAPQRLRDLIGAAGPAHFASGLDLGCGTGLLGALLRPWVDVLHGVDLSPQMIERARQKGVYDELFVGELVALLAGDTGRPRYDLVTASDVLIYLGDLEPLCAATRRRLAPGGRFAFTVEHDDTADVLLHPTGRYSHARAYLERLAAAHGFAILTCEPGELRREAFQPVMGLLSVWTVPR